MTARLTASIPVNMPGGRAVSMAAVLVQGCTANMRDRAHSQHQHPSRSTIHMQSSFDKKYRFQGYAGDIESLRSVRSTKPILSLNSFAWRSLQSAQFGYFRRPSRKVNFIATIDRYSLGSKDNTVTWSPLAIVAARPVIELAGDSLVRMAQQGQEFASLIFSRTGQGDDAVASAGKSTIEGSTIERLTELLRPLQAFLAGEGYAGEQSLQLLSDGRERWEVQAAADLQGAVESWIGQHPEWLESWQSAVAEHLDKQGPPSMPSVWARPAVHGQTVASPVLRWSVPLDA